MNGRSETFKFGLGMGILTVAIALLMMVPAAPAPQPGRGRDEIGMVSAYVTAPPAVDGDPSDAAWACATVVALRAVNGDNFPAGATDVWLKSVYTGTKVFFLVTWNDTADSYDRFPWLFNTATGKWYQADFENDTHATRNYEDKVSFFWDINDSIAAFQTSGCDGLCHISTPVGKPLMYTNAPGELADNWHWKRVRTGPVGQVDDQYVNNNSTAPEGGRFSDPKTGGGYSNNVQTLNYTDDPDNSTAVPIYYYPDATGMQSYYVLASDKDAAAKKVTGVYKNGTLVTASGMLVPDASTHLPGIIISPIAGDRGDLAGTGLWAGGKWTLEISRNLVTSSQYDVQFDDMSKPYFFGLAVFNNAQIGHATVDDVIRFTFAPRLPNVYVKSVSASPAGVKQGEAATVTVTLRNDGVADAVGAEINFFLDNGTTSLGKVNVNVTMGNATDATATFTWNTTGAAAGNHTITATVKDSGLSGVSNAVFVTIPSARFGIDGFSANAASATIDDNVNFTMTVKNTGDLGGAAAVTLLDGNTAVATVTLQVNAGASNTTNYLWKAAGPGAHTFFAKIGDSSKNVTVTVLTKASISLTGVKASRTSLKDQEKDSTQKVTLTVTLANSGQSPGTALLVVKEKDKVLFSGNITLDGGKDATKTVEWSIKGAGKHTATATISGAGTGTKTAVVDLSYKSPGFELAVLLAAAATGIVLFGRRRRA